MEIQIIFAIILGYLFGSIPFGKIIASRKQIDIQKQGSGNIGFANSLRVLGWKSAVWVLVGDVLKGVAAMLVAVALDVQTPGLYLVAAVTVAAHVYPVWLGFRGGKGVATGLGVLLVLNPILALMALSLHIITNIIIREWAVASVVAALSLPVLAFLFDRDLVVLNTALALFGVYTHRTNLRKFYNARSIHSN